MKHILPYFYICLIIFILTSCYDNNSTITQYNESELQKLDYINQLIKQYGWTKDYSISDTERNKMLLDADIIQLEDFLHHFSFDTICLTETSKSYEIMSHTSREILTNRKEHGFWATTVVGNHTSQFITSTSRIYVTYRYDDMFQIISSDLQSTPKCKWTPNTDDYKLNRFKIDSSKKKVEFGVSGVAKAYGISRNITMKAYIYFDTSKGLATDGMIESCH